MKTTTRSLLAVALAALAATPIVAGAATTPVAAPSTVPAARPIRVSTADPITDPAEIRAALANEMQSARQLPWPDVHTDQPQR